MSYTENNMDKIPLHSLSLIFFGHLGAVKTSSVNKTQPCFQLIDIDSQTVSKHVLILPTHLEDMEQH